MQKMKMHKWRYRKGEGGGCRKWRCRNGDTEKGGSLHLHILVVGERRGGCRNGDDLLRFLYMRNSKGYFRYFT